MLFVKSRKLWCYQGIFLSGHILHMLVTSCVNGLNSDAKINVWLGINVEPVHTWYYQYRTTYVPNNDQQWLKAFELF